MYDTKRPRTCDLALRRSAYFIEPEFWEIPKSQPRSGGKIDLSEHTINKCFGLVLYLGKVVCPVE